MTAMETLEKRGTAVFGQSLILFLKSFKQDGPNYISKFVYTSNIKLNKIYEPASGLNVVQPRYNSEPYHAQLLLHMIAHMWNQWPPIL